MPGQKTIGFIIVDKSPEQLAKSVEYLNQELPHINLIRFEEIDDLFRYMLSPQILRLDYVVIDIEHLYKDYNIMEFALKICGRIM